MTKKRNLSIANLYGQLMATQALLVRVASYSMTPEELIREGEQAIETLRATALPSEMPEEFLEGLNEVAHWVKHVAD